MKKSVIIFDGEEDHEIGTEFFFQNPLIEGLKPTDVVSMYQSTAVFTSVIRDIQNLIESNAVISVNDRKTDPGYVKKVEDGLYILEGMLMDLFGDDAGNKIIESTNKNIDEYQE
jgi:hypothetical protein